MDIDKKISYKEERIRILERFKNVGHKMLPCTCKGCKMTYTFEEVADALLADDRKAVKPSFHENGGFMLDLLCKCNEKEWEGI